MVARQTAPVLGAQQSPYLDPGEWQIFASYRHLRSDRHFKGTEEQVEREHLGTFVVNKQQILDLAPTYAVNRQFNLTLSVPILVYGSWSIPLPTAPTPGPRQVQSASGLGDVSLTARYWLLDCDKHTKHNISLGLGVKAPTGNYDAQDRFPRLTGQNPQVKPVDISIQPGDGGWGIILDLQAFRQVGTATWFASGTYLMNPRDTNGTPSILVNLFGQNVPANLAHLKINSVPDQYLARVGVALPVPTARGLSVVLAGRIEGVPPNDVLGDSNGWRRPGYSIFVEPGLVYTRGNDTFSITVPVATQRNRQADFSNFEGDATFADYFILAGYSHRFGKSTKRPARR